MFGVNEHGNSVAVYIHGFTPYGYFALPPEYEFEGAGTDQERSNLEKIREKLNQCLQQANTRGRKDTGDDGHLCLAVRYISDQKSIMGFKTTHTKFLKVYVAMPTMVPTLKRLMEEGIDVPGIVRTNQQSTMNYEMEGKGISFQPFECNVPFVLRFMIDREITGAGWLTIPKATYKLRLDEADKQTHCQVSHKTSLFLLLHFILLECMSLINYT